MIGESQVPEDVMAKNAKLLAERGITEDDAGAVIIDFSKHVPGKEGKQLVKAVLR